MVSYVVLGMVKVSGKRGIFLDGDHDTVILG